EYVITVNLAPADLRKSGGAYDLAIAVATLAAIGKLPSDGLEATAMLGGLSLSGALPPGRGVRPALRSGLEKGIARAGAPRASTREAASVPGIEVRTAVHLADIVAHLKKGAPLEPAGDPPEYSGATVVDHVDLEDVRGQHAARRALEVAAAGGHNLLMMGPP